MKLLQAIQDDIGKHLIKQLKHKELSATINRLEKCFIAKVDSSLPIPFYMEKWNDAEAFNAFIYELSQAGWIVSVLNPFRKWGEFKLSKAKMLSLFDSESDMHEWRAEQKASKYKMEKKDNTVPNRTKTSSGRIKDTGLVRQGMAQAAMSEFTYDLDMLEKYRYEIIENAVASMIESAKKEGYSDSLMDEASYVNICEKLINFYVYNDKTYNLEGNINDSRGRAIKLALKKFLNPIGSKDGRSLLVKDIVSIGIDDQDAIDNIYLFIAELQGFKSKTIEAKIKSGRASYNQRMFLEFDNRSEELKELHSNIWLERIYIQLDSLYSDYEVEWVTPIEIDFTASMLAIEALLLDHYDYADLTNVIYNGELKDAWTIPGVTRPQVKAVNTPKLYGSNRTEKELLETNAKETGLKYTRETIKILSKELRTGRFSVANGFNRFIINHSKPEEVMDIVIGKDKFQIECNKYQTIGEKMHQYDCWDSVDQTVKTIFNFKTKKIADLKQFRTFLPTLLMHNRDSFIANKISLKQTNNGHWIIDNHDAFLTCPTQATAIREYAVKLLEKLYKNREKTLRKFFKSIGIDMNNKMVAHDWSELKSKCNPIPEGTKFSGYCLK